MTQGIGVPSRHLIGKSALIASLILAAFATAVRADTGGSPDWLLLPGVTHLAV